MTVGFLATFIADILPKF